jgi:Uma2 family endonuclease
MLTTMTSTVHPAAAALHGPSRWPLSVAAYHALTELGLIPRRTELIRGFVYHKMSKTPRHSLLVLRLLGRLQAQLPAGHHLRSEQPITGPDSEPEPDVSVIRGEAEDFSRRHPTTAELVIEVCITSHDYDRDKAGLYAAAGVEELWLVLGPDRAVEVHRRPVAGRYAEFIRLGGDATLVCTALPGVSLPLPWLFRD